MTSIARNAFLSLSISGLLVEKKQVELGGPGEFDNLWSTEEILDKLASAWLGGVNWWHGVTKEDHAQLVAIFAESFERAGALLKAIQARPPTKHAINAPRPDRHNPSDDRIRPANSG